jgi:hypothetical protein
LTSRPAPHGRVLSEKSALRDGSTQQGLVRNSSPPAEWRTRGAGRLGETKKRAPEPRARAGPACRIGDDRAVIEHEQPRVSRWVGSSRESNVDDPAAPISPRAAPVAAGRRYAGSSGVASAEGSCRVVADDDHRLPTSLRHSVNTLPPSRDEIGARRPCTRPLEPMAGRARRRRRCGSALGFDPAETRRPPTRTHPRRSVPPYSHAVQCMRWRAQGRDRSGELASLPSARGAIAAADPAVSTTASCGHYEQAGTCWPQFRAIDTTPRPRRMRSGWPSAWSDRGASSTSAAKLRVASTPSVISARDGIKDRALPPSWRST